MAEGGDDQLTSFDEMEVPELAEGGNRDFNIQYIVQIVTNIEGSDIETIGGGSESQDSNARASESTPSEKPAANQAMIGEENFEETLSGGVDDANIVEEKPAFVLFDNKSGHLYRVDPVNKSLTKMKKYPHRVRFIYDAVSFDQYIYFFCFYGFHVHRLEYSDVTATWKKMSDWPKEHKGLPRVAASSDVIYMVGGSFLGKLTKLVSKYIPALDKWERLNHKLTAVRSLTLLCNNDHLYSIGGYDENDQRTSSVERMNLQTKEWSRIAKMRSEVNVCCAAEYEGKIFVFYQDREGLLVSSWDPKFDEWTKFERIHGYSITKSFWYLKKAFVIDGIFYLVSNTEILPYDVKKNELSSVMSYPDMINADAALIATK